MNLTATAGTDADALRALERAFETRASALLTSDVEALAALLSDDLVYCHSSGATDTKATFLQAVGDGNLIYRALSGSRMDASIRGDVAWIQGVLHIEAEVGGEPRKVSNRILEVWLKDRSSGWRLAARSGVTVT